MSAVAENGSAPFGESCAVGQQATYAPAAKRHLHLQDRTRLSRLDVTLNRLRIVADQLGAGLSAPLKD
jgi:hypothetical protein